MDLKSLPYDELNTALSLFGYPKFRTDQVFSWLHEKLEVNPAKMTNLPKELKQKLISDSDTGLSTCHEIVDVQSSKDGTKKFLYRLLDGNLVESVLMKYEYGYSVCISTQVGCAMHCAFCASGMDGLVRDLTASEIIEEVYGIARHIGERISRIVFMGMGEPLMNYENVTRAIKILCDKRGQDLSERHITLSTCGIVPGIKRLADDDLSLTLALSLHSPFQEEREKIMPITRKYPLKDVIETCKYYREKTGRRVTFEYCLQGGINDTDRDVDGIYTLLKGTDSHVNIIPVHKVEGIDYHQADSPLEFKKKLEKKGINVTIRRELGQDIDGACGQLRMKHNRKG